MRIYSDSERSSAAASFAKSAQSRGGTRSFSSSVHFSITRATPKKESLPRVCPGTREAESRATTETTPRGGGSTVMKEWSRCCAAQVRPVDILAKFFAPNRAGRLALDGNRQSFAAEPAIGDVAQVANGGSAPFGKCLAVCRLQRQPVGPDIHTLMIFTIRCWRQHRAVNSPKTAVWRFFFARNSPSGVDKLFTVWCNCRHQPHGASP